MCMIHLLFLEPRICYPLLLVIKTVQYSLYFWSITMCHPSVGTLCMFMLCQSIFQGPTLPLTSRLQLDKFFYVCEMSSFLQWTLLIMHHTNVCRHVWVPQLSDACWVGGTCPSGWKCALSMSMKLGGHVITIKINEWQEWTQHYTELK